MKSRLTLSSLEIRGWNKENDASLLSHPPISFCLLYDCERVTFDEGQLVLFVSIIRKLGYGLG